MQSTNWAPEHSEALREYLAKGMSYSEIADAINAKFNTGYSRNATIGRAKRVGLAGTDRPTQWPKLAPNAQQPSLRKIRERLDAEFRRRTPIFESVEPAKLRCAEINPRHLSLLDLTPGDCRYPYGGDAEGEAITFCGHPRREDSSYCTAHFRLICGPGVAPEPAADTVSLSVVEAA
jgi:GcrA cell cycle regulator